MNRSKVYSASCFAYALFSYLELANLGGSTRIFVTALNHPAVKEGHNDVFHSTKSQAISKWRANNLRSASASASESEIQVIDPSELQGKNETNNNLVSDHTENSADLQATRPRKVLGYGFSPLAELVLLQRRFFNRLDAMDKMIVRNTLPLVGLVALVPLLQSADLFWVNQLGDTLAVSAQSAANTLYQFSFGLISFLPSVTATLVSKNFANNDIERTESTINTALLFGLTTSSIIAMTLFANPGRYLGAVLKDGNPALVLSVKYMRIRCLSLIPQMVSFVCFAAFRGMLEYKACIKISLIASCFDIVLKPILIHVFRFGILGSATSTLLCDSFNAICYMKLLQNRGFFAMKKLFAVPSWIEVSPLLKGSTLQARSFAMHLTNLIVARKIQSFDDSGVMPAAFALAMQTFFTGGICIYAMAMSAQTLYPNAIAKCKEEEKAVYIKILLQRLLGRGFWVGATIACIQALLFPIILRTTPLAKVREAAIFPIMTMIALQAINGIVCVGEAIMVGNGKFASASIVLIVASIGYTGCLQLLPQGWGINGVAISFVVFNLLRLLGFASFLPSLMNHNQTRSQSSVEDSQR